MTLVSLPLHFASAAPTTEELLFLISMAFVAVFSYKMSAMARRIRKS